nr:hypothetical protein Iba_chr03bCG2530 [Ipomoea batatas]
MLSHSFCNIPSQSNEDGIRASSEEFLCRPHLRRGKSGEANIIADSPIVGSHNVDDDSAEESYFTNTEKSQGSNHLLNYVFFLIQLCLCHFHQPVQ